MITPRFFEFPQRSEGNQKYGFFKIKKRKEKKMMFHFFESSCPVSYVFLFTSSPLPLRFFVFGMCAAACLRTTRLPTFENKNGLTRSFLFYGR
jgi:hypothetical protein